MKYIFTSNSTPLSQSIRALFPTPSGVPNPSHCIMLFFNHIVVQSNLYGVGIDWWKQFKQSNNICYVLDAPAPSPKDESAFMQTLLDKYDGDSYDYAAFAYFTAAALRYRTLGTPMPKRNPWKNKDTFLCTEWDGNIPPWLTITDPLPDLGITTPYMYYGWLSKYLKLGTAP